MQDMKGVMRLYAAMAGGVQNQNWFSLAKGQQYGQQPVVGVSKETFQRQQHLANAPPAHQQFASTFGPAAQQGIQQMLFRLFGQGGGF
jgi:hypothetical protein